MDAIEMLRSQHRRTEGLFQAIEAAGRETKGQLFLDLVDALAVHAAIEERHFYPAVNDPSTREILIASIDEHMAIKRAVADLLRAGVSNETLDIELRALRDAVTRHVREEEARLFPKVRELLDSHRLDELARVMAATMDDLRDPELRSEALVDAGHLPHPY